MMLEFWKTETGQTNIYFINFTADKRRKRRQKCKFDVSVILTKQQPRRFIGKHGSNG